MRRRHDGLGTPAESAPDAIPRDRPADGERRWSLTAVPPAPEQVRDVRRQALAVLRSWRLDHAAWQVELLLSELVTNAVMHARTRFSVVLTRANAVLRCEVTDASPLAPEPRRTPAEGQAGGRGLLLVESVASRWGVERHRHGKTVWFDLPLRPVAQPGH